MNVRCIHVEMIPLNGQGLAKLSFDAPLSVVVQTIERYERCGRDDATYAICLDGKPWGLLMTTAHARGDA